MRGFFADRLSWKLVSQLTTNRPIEACNCSFAKLATSTAVFHWSFLTNAIIWRSCREVVLRELPLPGFFSKLFLMENRDLMRHTVDWFIPLYICLYPLSKTLMIAVLLTVDSCLYYKIHIQQHLEKISIIIKWLT